MKRVQDVRQIMVVDDEPGMLILLDVMLKRSGFDVLAAADAFTALEMLERSTPDLIIVDVMMPGTDGIELCRQIRARTQTARTPIIILSARDDPESVEQGFAAGADDYLTKPIFHHALLTQVRAILDLEDTESAS